MEGIWWHEQGKRRGHAACTMEEERYITPARKKKELYAAGSIKGGSYTTPNEKR